MGWKQLLLPVRQCGINHIIVKSGQNPDLEQEVSHEVVKTVLTFREVKNTTFSPKSRVFRTFTSFGRKALCKSIKSAIFQVVKVVCNPCSRGLFYQLLQKADFTTFC